MNIYDNMPVIYTHEKAKPWYKEAESKSYRTGLRHKIFYPKGGYYKGDWLHGYKCGKGIELLASGLQYEGEWICNKKNGFGVLSKFDPFEKKFFLIYRGDFKNDKKHGYGCFYYDNKTFYEGEFKNDAKQGFGRCWFYDGSYYEGYWFRDMQHGYGMLVEANKNRYEGEWINGKKGGWGIFYHLDSGQKQTGLWEKDICVSSNIEDLKFRQSAFQPTPFPIQKLDLDPSGPFSFFLGKAETMILQYNKGCQLHKYCYKISPEKF